MEFKYFEEEHDQSIDLQEGLINLYLSVKVGTTEETLTDEQIEEEG